MRVRVVLAMFILAVCSGWGGVNLGGGVSASGSDSTETPNGTVSLSNSDCTTGNAHTTMDDDPDSPDAVWCNATADGTNHIMLQNFTDPAGALSGTTDAQVFALYVRRSAAAGTNPSVTLNIYDGVNCADLHEAGAAQTVTSDTGELLTEAWTSTGISSPSDVCVQISCARSGGAPGDRRSCDYDAIEWRAAA